jgi:hypothetical protein
VTYPDQKGTLEFNLQDPDSNNAFKRAVSATDAYIFMHEFSQWLRKIDRYDSQDKEIKDTPEVQEAIERIREVWYKMQEEYNIDMDLLD